MENESSYYRDPVVFAGTSETEDVQAEVDFRGPTVARETDLPSPAVRVCLLGGDLRGQHREELHGVIHDMVLAVLDERRCGRETVNGAPAAPPVDWDSGIYIDLRMLQLDDATNIRLQDAMRKTIRSSLTSALTQPVLVCVNYGSTPGLPGHRLDVADFVKTLATPTQKYPTPVDALNWPAGPSTIALYFPEDTLRLTIYGPESTSPWAWGQHPETHHVFLSVRPNITWWKGISAWNGCVGRLGGIDLESGFPEYFSLRANREAYMHAEVGSSPRIYWPADTIVFQKAKGFGNHTNMYHWSPPRYFWRVFGGTTARYEWVGD